jgi:hypothetical protein
MASATARAAILSDEDSRVVEHELALMDAAVGVVRDGGARRITLVGMRWAPLLLAQARAVGTNGVVIRAASRGPGAGYDLAIERDSSSDG